MKTAYLALALATASVSAAANSQHIKSSPDLGKAEGQCRPNEPGPALIVVANGLKDRAGLLRAEVYPTADKDFLEDDNVLVMAGKTFRRVEVAIPATGLATVCIRIPAAGNYTLSLLHDHDGNHKFGLSSDGIGFPGNPKLGFSKPKARQAFLTAGPGLTTVPITLNYRHGLFSFSPLDRSQR